MNSSIRGNEMLPIIEEVQERIRLHTADSLSESNSSDSNPFNRSKSERKVFPVSVISKPTNAQQLITGVI